MTGSPDERVPELLALRTKALLKRGKPADAVVTAERFAAWAETQETNRERHRYDAACCFALCAAAIEKDRDRLVGQSLALLRKARTGGYFTKETVAHLKADSDFDGIRKHPAFVAFVAELDKP